jgi:polyisoprenoid-binding protein YceI
MIKKLLFLGALLNVFVASAQSYNPTDAGSKVRFVIKNFGINTGGTFEGLTGTIVFDPTKLPTSSFEVSVDAKTVDTDMEARDKHLRSDEYFDVEKFPKIIFKSSRIATTNKAEFLYVFGTITIKGVSKEANFPFSYKEKDGGYLFEGEFKLNRRDFGVGGKSFSMSDELTVQLSVFAKKN